VGYFNLYRYATRYIKSCLFLSEQYVGNLTPERYLYSLRINVFYSCLFASTCSVMVLLSLSGMLLLASGLLTASHRNYPGGEALDRLLQQHLPMHFLEHTEEHMPLSKTFKPTFVHIDAATAMSGVTR